MKGIVTFFLVAFCLVGTTYAGDSRDTSETSKAIGGAQYAEGEKPASEATSSPDMAAIQTANDLAKYGYSVESASALIEAALILAQTPTRPLDVKPEQIGDAAEAKTAKIDFTPDALLSDARRFAEGDENMLTWANEVAEIVASSKTRGAVGGPLYAVNLLGRNCSNRYAVKFEAGRYAEIAVYGDGDGDLDLYVYNENWDLIIYDEDYYDVCYVSWVPRWRGVFYIVVKNNGRYSDQYYIYTN
jgi:hypothetical protein